MCYWYCSWSVQPLAGISGMPALKSEGCFKDTKKPRLGGAGAYVVMELCEVELGGFHS